MYISQALIVGESFEFALGRNIMDIYTESPNGYDVTESAPAEFEEAVKYYARKLREFTIEYDDINSIINIINNLIINSYDIDIQRSMESFILPLRNYSTMKSKPPRIQKFEASTLKMLFSIYIAQKMF